MSMYRTKEPVWNEDVTLNVSKLRTHILQVILVTIKFMTVPHVHVV